MSSVPPATLMQDRKFWLEFISQYQTMPSLWKATQSSRKYRDLALMSLLKRVRARWPEANIEFIKQRISNFRRTFLNEYEKVQQAKKSQQIYVPSLYYYNNLKFLKEDEQESDDQQCDISKDGEQVMQHTKKFESVQKIITPAKENIKMKETHLQNFNETQFETETIYVEANPQKRIKLIPITHEEAVESIVIEHENYDTVVSIEEESNESVQKFENHISIVDNLPEEEDGEEELSSSTSPSTACEPKANDDNNYRITRDEFDEIAKRVATHFRKMEPEQCLFAEKLIFDICVSARLKRLSENTCISNP